MAPSSGSSLRVVGRVVKPHGVRGELLVDVRTDFPAQRFATGVPLRTSRLGRDGPTLVVASARPHSGRLLVCFEGVTDRSGAQDLRGSLLLADTEGLEAVSDPDEFHDQELEGLLAITTDAVGIGTVREVAHGQAADLLVIESANGGRELLVPFVREIVPDVDITGGRIVIDPPDGLLDG